MHRDFLQAILIVIMLVSAIMFVLVAIQGSGLYHPPATAAFAPEVPVAPAGWLHSRSHVIVLSASAEPQTSRLAASEAL